MSARRLPQRSVPLLFAGLLLLTSARAAAGQYPGELAGQVTDAVSGAPLESVLVELVGTGTAVLSDGRGRFRIRGLEPGRHRIRYSRLGYESRIVETRLRNGEVTWLDVRLGPRPIQLAEVRAEVTGEPIAGPAVIMIARAEIEASGELNVAELLKGRAGLVVQDRGPGGRQTVSIRGGSADEVLVLLDGAPLNDPLTGEADLSSIPASQIESITVLKGGASARLGPGAVSGAVLIESRASAEPMGLRAQTGSLGFWSGSGEVSGGVPGLEFSAGGQLRRLDGSFVFERPAALGGGRALRRNSDLSEGSAFAAAVARLADGELRLRAGFTRVRRGIPGPSYAPTLAARETLTRWNGQAGWERWLGLARVSAQLHAVGQAMRFADASPPLGPPYDSRSEAVALGGRLVADVSPRGALRSLSGGLELRQQRYESTALDESAPGGRFDFGVFFAGELGLARGARGPRLAAALRLDRDGLERSWYATHELALTARVGPATFHVRQASAYSPPTFGDQFFREGVAVEPNPGLRAERVPNDLSIGASLDGAIGSLARGRVGLLAYVADVEDMIIWSPDFRFVWSPGNFDIKRRGLEAEASLELPARHLALRAAYSLARATYDRPGDVQVIYRPRHSGSVGATWRPARWDFALDARFVGTRYPVPARLNALAPYWTLDLRVRRGFAAGAWRITPTLSVERLLDNEDSLIFGYPEPGRVIRLEVAARPR